MVGAGCGDTDCGQLDGEGRVENNSMRAQGQLVWGQRALCCSQASDILSV